MPKQETSALTSRRTRATARSLRETANPSGSNNSHGRELPLSEAAGPTSASHATQRVHTEPEDDVREHFKFTVDVGQDEDQVHIQMLSLDERPMSFMPATNSLGRSITAVMHNEGISLKPEDIISIECDRGETWPMQANWREFMEPYENYKRVFAQVTFRWAVPFDNADERRAPADPEYAARVLNDKSFIPIRSLPPVPSAGTEEDSDVQDSEDDRPKGSHRLSFEMTIEEGREGFFPQCQVVHISQGRWPTESLSLSWARTVGDTVRFACVLHDIPFNSVDDILHIESRNGHRTYHHSEPLAAFHGTFIHTRDVLDIDLR